MDAQELPRNVLRELLEDQAQVLVLLELGFANHALAREVIHSGLGDLGLKDAHVGYQVQTCGREPKQTTKYAAELCCFSSSQRSVAVLGVLDVLGLQGVGKRLLIHLVPVGNLGVLTSTMGE